MDNSLEYYNDLITIIKKTWDENKKSKEIIKKFELLLESKIDVDIELYLIYLNTLVNLGEYNKAILEVDSNNNISNIKEIISFKIKLLYFLKRYKECENYIKCTNLDRDNQILAQKILNKINQNNLEKENYKNTVDTIHKKDTNKSMQGERLINSEINPKIKLEENKHKQNISKKLKLKVAIPVISLITVIIFIGVYSLKREAPNDINLETFINISNSNDLIKYKSMNENIDYKLPVNIEFEFISAADLPDNDKKVYATYKVSDKSIARITEDGFFKAKKTGIVDIHTLVNNKIINTITIETVSE